MIRAFLIRFNCSGVRVLKNSPSSRMWRYGAAAIAASIRRHMGWDLSRIIASKKSRGSASGRTRSVSSLMTPGSGNRPRLFPGGYVGGSRVVGIGLALRKEKGRRWEGWSETPPTAMMHAPCVVKGRTLGRSTCMVQGERPILRPRGYSTPPSMPVEKAVLLAR
jgi:hypothetical protein